MTSGGSWRELYHGAIREPDYAVQKSRIGEARLAIFDRLLALCDLTSSHESEEKQLNEALRQLWIAENLQKPLPVEELASHVAMSVRNFERVFTREVGITPAQYVLHVRVEAARRELQQTDKGFKQVAAATGFGSADSMRRAFLRLLDITPRTYRAQLSARTRTAAR